MFLNILSLYSKIHLHISFIIYFRITTHLIIDFYLILFEGTGELSKNEDVEEVIISLHHMASCALRNIKILTTEQIREKEITIDDHYTLLLNNVTVDLVHPLEGSIHGDENETYPFLAFGREAIALHVECEFDVINEEEYKEGGRKYEKGKARFEEGKL